MKKIIDFATLQR